MPKITYIDFEGTERQVDAEVGATVMETALDNNIPGIDADCGGACACATCHVYINEDWLQVVGKANEVEAEMLDVVDEAKDNSRLSCQIDVTDELDGLIVNTPESQH